MRTYLSSYKIGCKADAKTTSLVGKVNGRWRRRFSSTYQSLRCGRNVGNTNCRGQPRCDVLDLSGPDKHINVCQLHRSTTVHTAPTCEDLSGVSGGVDLWKIYLTVLINRLAKVLESISVHGNEMRNWWEVLLLNELREGERLSYIFTRGPLP
ncbi:hypothetical protein PHLGIDRAFT_384392 [Phlebiopsis gigantea 11061_1 CR5-6]|uniref:Uncharacterized protein n=1 Tax=Phlebiopsis gigantea (strain 11061_1 CR5-6) TaxID=745531 RepID=A0A0C3SBT1_PHLG1|nr:hypothetical protein PHLGIDRAFT_384392 [Phlebiopsis gigantea 11061_1 CR5-6]